jgi:hypothetical protein
METEVLKRLINVEEYYKMAGVGILKPDERLELISMFPLILLGRDALGGFEDPVEIGDVFKPAFITYPRNIQIFMKEQLTGISNSYLIEKLGKCFQGGGFKKATKGSFVHMRNFRSFL